MSAGAEQFWESLSLAEMSREQWESLCDGCGKCCVHKLEDEDSGEVYLCNVVCRLFDLQTGRCRDYTHRQQHVPDCVMLNVEKLAEFHWLPATCAYRLLAEEAPLLDWHPLISGNSLSVLHAGQSVVGRVVSEDNAGDLSHHITDWQW
ncbi:MAG: YcgN family cysteine cluster protein [Gammaproteobacteria bacterium]|nr:YcgN family cysteine cluster protein [Gammaproteobacteria bacterium]